MYRRCCDCKEKRAEKSPINNLESLINTQFCNKYSSYQIRSKKIKNLQKNKITSAFLIPLHCLHACYNFTKKKITTRPVSIARSVVGWRRRGKSEFRFVECRGVREAGGERSRTVVASSPVKSVTAL